MSTDFERLNIILAARDREFARAMERNQRRVERFARQSQRNLSQTSKSFDALGFAVKRFAPVMAALSAGAVVARLQKTISALDDIGKTADKIGLSTDALQELRTVAESAGVSQESLDSSMERFSKRLGEAAQGAGAASKTIKGLGLEASELATMGLDNALSVVADRLAGMSEPTERAAAAAALFGREGVAMVNLLREGSEGMERMRQEARDLGIILDEEMIRGAEDAQTQLDLMSRVISAQLNSALIDLAPLLVGAATAVADVARALNSGIDAVQNFIRPQSDLQLAAENVVLAMADEIDQSQILNSALNKGIVMSQATARAKLSEARARHENAKAAAAEMRAMVLGSDQWSSLTDQINTAQDALRSLGSEEVVLQSKTRSESYEREQAALVDLITRRQELLAVNDELQAQINRTGENVATLEAAIGNSGGGTVNVGDYVSPIENSAKNTLAGAGGAAKAAIPDLSNYADVMARIKAAFGDSAAAGDTYKGTLAQIEAMYRAGVLSSDEYEAALGAVENRFEGAKSAADSLRASTARTFADIVTGAQSASDAVSNLLSNLAGQFANAAFGSVLRNVGLFDGLGTLLSFDGGGYTGAGPRVGGLDGKGGQLAMVHPNETVIDHTRGQKIAARSGAQSVQIMIDVTGARGNAEIEEMVQTGVARGLKEYDRTVLPGSVRKINGDPRRLR